MGTSSDGRPSAATPGAATTARGDLRRRRPRLTATAWASWAPTWRGMAAIHSRRGHQGGAGRREVGWTLALVDLPGRRRRREHFATPARTPIDWLGSRRTTTGSACRPCEACSAPTACCRCPGVPTMQTGQGLPAGPQYTVHPPRRARRRASHGHRNGMATDDAADSPTRGALSRGLPPAPSPTAWTSAIFTGPCSATSVDGQLRQDLRPRRLRPRDLRPRSSPHRPLAQREWPRPTPSSPRPARLPTPGPARFPESNSTLSPGARARRRRETVRRQRDHRSGAVGYRRGGVRGRYSLTWPRAGTPTVGESWRQRAPAPDPSR